MPRSPARPGSTTRATSPSTTTCGSIGTTSRPLAHSRIAVGRLERRELLQRLDGREHEQDLLAPVGLDRALGREPAEVDGLAAVGPRLRAVGGGGEVEVRVEADLDLARGDPARELDERVRVVDRPRSPPPRPRARPRPGGPRPASTAPPGKTQAPPMKRCAGLRLTSRTSSVSAPPRSTITVAAWRGVVAAPVLSSSPGPGRSTFMGERPYYPGMTTTSAAQKWICESCGFIYDPADGDPDGGIPPGTPFEDIPDRLVLPRVRGTEGRFQPLRGLIARRGRSRRSSCSSSWWAPRRSARRSPRRG